MFSEEMRVLGIDLDVETIGTQSSDTGQVMLCCVEEEFPSSALEPQRSILIILGQPGL